jgi:hypothetical protein
MHLIQVTIRRCRHRFEDTTSILKLNLGFSKTWLGFGCINHGDNHLGTLLLGTTTTTTLLGLGATTFLLDVHHTPHDEDEDKGVYEKTQSRGASRGSGDPGTQNSPDETESLGVGDDEERQTRNDGDDELLLLLLTVASATTIFKNTHD